MEQSNENAADEFAKRCDPLNQTLEKQADIRMGFLAGYAQAQARIAKLEKDNQDLLKKLEGVHKVLSDVISIVDEIEVPKKKP